MEEDLLAALEDLAQKTDVLTHWADEMYEFVKAVPQSLLTSQSMTAKQTLIQVTCRAVTGSLEIREA